MLNVLSLFTIGFGSWLMASTPLPLARGKHTVIEEHQFYCKALGRQVAYSIYLPKQGTMHPDSFPLLLLLHGDGRNHRTIAHDDSCRGEVVKRKVVVVFPTGERSWYLDSKVNPQCQYQSMLLELLTHIRQTYPVYQSARQTGIGGWSMGGFGAVHFAETYPHQVGAVATVIGLLDFPNPRLPKEYNYPVSAVFGADATAWSLINCLNRAEKLAGKPLLQITGKQAFDYTMNQNFHRRLQKLKIPHRYLELDGKHDFQIVRRSLPLLLDFFQRELTVSPLHSFNKP